ncbi:MAG: DUF1499 domain-containing protein [Synechococcales cyanobacterium RM1_1_8]|nr:DUF1499 domain-containing protein [Synechococcales cyanobacterium RM1_1_8]
MFKFSGTRPSNLGVSNGQFNAPVPDSPNCVSSQAPASDREHYIAPLAIAGSEAIAKLKTHIQALERTAIIEATDNYLYAEFTTKLMGYVDDVEFYADGSGSVQVRSASRLGKSDLGLNRQRIEAIRSALA